MKIGLTAVEAEVEFKITFRIKPTKLKILGIGILPKVIFKVISYFFNFEGF